MFVLVALLASGIIGFAQQISELSHLVCQVAVEWRGDDGCFGHAGGIFGVYQTERLGGHAPVTVAVSGEDTVHEVALLHVENPAFHGIIVQADGLKVAEARVKHVGNGDKRAGPGHIVGVMSPIVRPYIT